MKEVIRTCCVCKKKQNKNNMCRIAKQDELVTVDNLKKINGRATYVCYSENCINELINKKLLNRSFKCNLSSDIYNKIKEELIVARNKHIKN